MTVSNDNSEMKIPNFVLQRKKVGGSRAKNQAIRRVSSGTFKKSALVSIHPKTHVR